jgi:hypothetical protein
MYLLTAYAGCIRPAMLKAIAELVRRTSFH